MEHGTGGFTLFVGAREAARGDIAHVARQAVACRDAGETERLAFFQDATGACFDVDLRGAADEVIARLARHPLVGPLVGPAAEETGAAAEAPAGVDRRGPGRPRLGVVSREVSLLPRHWEWLAGQRGGASAALRRLVDAARRDGEAADRAQRARDACYRAMAELAGDRPGFEEAARALYAGAWTAFEGAVAAWPPDVRGYLLRLAAGAR